MKLTKQKLYDLIQEVYYDSRKQHSLYANAQDHIGERVWVHTERTQRNNGYNGMIGVYKAGGSDNKVGTPYFKTNAIALQDCVFKVSGGKAIEKIQQTGKRTLVAGCTGTIVQIDEKSYNPAVGAGKQPYEEVSFNPKVGYFYALNDPDKRPLISCKLLYFTASEDGQWTMTGLGLSYELIQEAIDDYDQSETNFFGKGIAEIIEKGNEIYKNDKAFLNPAWIVKNVGRRIGAGYSREVFQIGNSNMVVKFALPEELKEGIQSNGFEVELFNQYPFVFPRTYIFDKSEGGPEWLVIEKVTVIENGFEYDEIVANCFPSLVKASQMFIDAGYDKVDASFLFERLLDSYEESEGSDVLGLWMDIIFHSRRLKGGDDEVKKKLAEESWAIATNNADLMKFITTCLDLGVNFDEIREGNIGTNDEKNKLMLIDISKFQFVEE